MKRVSGKTGKILSRLLLFVLALALLSGCAQAESSARFFPTPAKEDRLIIYTSDKEETYAPLIKEFEERTGIWVQVETGGTIELLERIAAEADDPRCDVILGGGLDTLYSFRNLFSPYQSPQSKDLPAGLVQEDGLWTPFSVLPVVLIYNTKLVRTNPPVGWADLFDPAWRGKIAFANPETSGSSYTALATMLQALPGDKHTLISSFVDNLDGRTIDSAGMVVSEVASGSCYIGVTLEENALHGIKNGYDIGMVYPSEGTSAVPDGLAIISGCDHEENARRFMDFTLSRDVQAYLSEFCTLRPVRTDVPLPENVETNLRLIPYDVLWAGSFQEEYLALWHSLSGEVTP